MKVHLQRHEGVRRFLCEHCQASFLTTSDFKRHMRTHDTGWSTYFFSARFSTFPPHRKLHFTHLFLVPKAIIMVFFYISGEKAFAKRNFIRAEPTSEHINQVIASNSTLKSKNSLTFYGYCFYSNL